MKRFVAFIITAFLTVASAFAVTGEASGVSVGPQPSQAQTEVVLKLSESDLSSWRIGITDDVTTNNDWKETTNDMADLPTATGSIDLSSSWGQDTFTIISKSYHVYYKVRGTQPFTLTLAATKPLTREDGDTIDYTVKVTGGSGEVRTGSNSSVWTDTVAMGASKPYAADSYSFTIETDPITAAQTGTYNSSLTLNIAASN